MNDNAAVPHKLTKVMELVRELSVSSLQELQTFVSKEIHTRGAEERRAAIAQIAAIAQANGIDLRTLSTARLPKMAKDVVKVAAVYANPADAKETWSGRGRKPRWLAAQLDAGEDISKFKIAA